MASNRGKKSTRASSRTGTSSGRMSRSEQERNDKSFSAGMHSLDSTQVPLRTSDGEPDWRGIKGKGSSSTGNRKKK